MKITKEDIVITIAMVSTIVSVILGVKLITANKTINDNKTYDVHLKAQNDSLINANIVIVKVVGDKDRKTADSAINIFNMNRVVDSLNKIKYVYNKNKVKSYTPAKRNAVYDSIFGSAK